MLRFGTFLGGAAAVIIGFSLLGIGQLAVMGTVSPILYDVTLYGGLVLMCGFVAYDTQRYVHPVTLGLVRSVEHDVTMFLCVLMMSHYESFLSHSLGYTLDATPASSPQNHRGL
jgi:hypothetical protein